MKERTEFEKLKDDVHYLIVAHCKYKDMSMYDRALSYNERFAFLIGFETSLKAVENAIELSEQLKENPSMIEWPERLCPDDYRY